MDVPCSQQIGLTLCLFLLLINHVWSFKSQGYSPFDVNHLPRFMPSGNNFTFKTGQEAILKCAIVNLGEKKVIWRRASDPTPLTVGFLSFSEDPRYSVQHFPGGNNWNLIISSVTKADAGVYECQVSSRMRHLRHHVTLMVTDAPARPKIQISGSNYVELGERIHLVCNATSKEYPPEDIDWFRNGDALTSRPSAGMFITKKVFLSTGTIYSTLEIKSANLSDQGPYVCRTSNRDVTSIFVNVLNGGIKNPYRRGTDDKNVGDTTKGDVGDNSATTTNVHSSFLVISLLTTFMTWKHQLVLEIT